jgi:hypothetical protein
MPGLARPIVVTSAVITYIFRMNVWTARRHRTTYAGGNEPLNRPSHFHPDAYVAGRR